MSWSNEVGIAWRRMTHIPWTQGDDRLNIAQTLIYHAHLLAQDTRLRFSSMYLIANTTEKWNSRYSIPTVYKKKPVINWVSHQCVNVCVCVCVVGGEGEGSWRKIEFLKKNGFEHLSTWTIHTLNLCGIEDQTLTEIEPYSFQYWRAFSVMLKNWLYERLQCWWENNRLHGH